MKEVVINFQELINKINPATAQSSFSPLPNTLANTKTLEEFALSSGTRQSAAPKIASIFSDREYWSLYENDKLLEPLKFSNGKTQEDVVRSLQSHQDRYACRVHQGSVWNRQERHRAQCRAQAWQNFYCCACQSPPETI